MSRNIFLRSAMEQYGEQTGDGAGPEAEVISPDTPDEVDTAQALTEARIENDDLTQDLIETSGDNEMMVSEKVNDEADAVTAAVESLQVLAQVVAASIHGKHFNKFTNAGYAMALESICNTVHIKGASVTAALEANEVAQYSPPTGGHGAVGGEEDEEKAKSQGIFNTVLDKLKQIWSAFVKMAKNFVYQFQNGLRKSETAALNQKVNATMQRIQVLVKEGKKGVIKDEKFIKYAGVGASDTINKMMINSSDVIGGLTSYISEFDKSAPVLIENIKKEPDEGTRAAVREMVWKLSGQFGEAIGGRDRADPKKVIDRSIPAGSEAHASPKLMGGLHIWVIRTKNDDKLPTVDVGLTHSSEPLAKEVATMGELDITYVSKAHKLINSLSERGVMDKLLPVIQRLDEQFPANWKKADTIQEVQAYATASISYIMKSLAALRGPVYGMLFDRYLHISMKWAVLSEAALSGVEEEATAGATSAAAKQPEPATA